MRGAGVSRRLYTDGILHSQFNPRRIVTGSVWDLLWLGLYFHPRPEPQRVLLLGLGAGTVVRQLQMLFAELHVTAVENDPVHVRVAREQFGIEPEFATIHLAVPRAVRAYPRTGDNCGARTNRESRLASTLPKA